MADCKWVGLERDLDLDEDSKMLRFYINKYEWNMVWIPLDFHNSCSIGHPWLKLKVPRTTLFS